MKNHSITATRLVVRAALSTYRALGRLRRRPVDVACALVVTGFIACAGEDSGVVVDVDQPASRRERTALEATTRLLQDLPALRAFSFVVDGFHADHDDPAKQTESLLACSILNDELTQCLMFDGEGKDARVVGVEYVVSAKAFAKLPAQEQALWHPHNYEVLSGQLVAPGLPGPVEKAVLSSWVNSWGKSWRTWDTGALGHHSDPVPLGEPSLLWSFNADGEVNPQLVADRRRRLEIEDRRAQRRDFVPQARAQRGVDALATSFPLRREIEGVRDEAQAARLVDVWNSPTAARDQQQRQQ